MTESVAPHVAFSRPAESPTGAKVVQLRDAVQERAHALNEWAHDQAHAVAVVAKEQPFAAAGISAGAAFAAGLVLGLLLSRAAPEPSWKDRILELKPHW
jgi:ElaB/YqjD/DUF883 family membrane-anchored ribosome-binding protein